MKPKGALIKLGGHRGSPGTTQRITHLVLAALVLLPNMAVPATLVVDGTDSTVAADGICSLREAIDNANDDAMTHADCAAGAGADTLELTADVSLTELDNGDRGLPVVTSEIAIDGGGFGVSRDDAAPDFGIFQVDAGGDLAIHSTTISNGVTAGVGGGVWNNGGDLTLSETTLTGNSAYYGGGVCTTSGGTTSMVDCDVVENEAVFGGGVVSLLYSEAGPSSSYLSQTRVIGNSSTIAGGGVFIEFAAEATLVGSTVSGNVAAGNGGGLVSVFDSDMTVSDSTVAENTAGYSGGGILVAFANSTITNSTFSGNYATWGGGIYSVYDGTTLTLENSTVIGNSGPDGYPGGGIYTYLTTIDMANNIVAANLPADCPGVPQTDLGNNFSSDLSCAGSAMIVPDIEVDTTLADNGGPTATHALLAGSAAIDAAASCGLRADQRGYGRDANCDSGSFEYAGSCELVIEGAASATAGESTPVDIHCATPGGRIAVVGGSNLGKKSRAVPGCGLVEFDVRPPRLFGFAEADAEGDAFADPSSPGDASGNAIYYQGIDFESCELTDVIAVELE